MAERECLAPARSSAAASGQSQAKGAAAAGGCVLALDIGGTKLAAALVDPGTGQADRVVMAPTPAGDHEQVWAGVAGLAGQFVTATAGAGARVRAVSVACPGPMDPIAGTVSPVNTGGGGHLPTPRPPT